MGVQISMGRGNFKGEGMARCKVQWYSAVICAKTAEMIEMPFGLWTWVDSRKHVLDGAQMPHAKEQLLREKTCQGMPNDTLPWAVQKWLNRSICSLGCGLGWAEGTQVQSCLPDCTNVPLWVGTLAPRGEYDLTICMRRRCGLMSNYFDNLFSKAV